MVGDNSDANSMVPSAIEIGKAADDSGTAPPNVLEYVLGVVSPTVLAS